MIGKIPVQNMYLPEKHNGGTGYNWLKEDIESRKEKKCTCGDYGMTVCGSVIDRYKDKYMHNKVGMVVGTQIPWAEAALLGNFGRP